MPSALFLECMEKPVEGPLYTAQCSLLILFYFYKNEIQFFIQQIWIVIFIKPMPYCPCLYLQNAQKLIERTFLCTEMLSTEIRVNICWICNNSVGWWQR